MPAEDIETREMYAEVLGTSASVVGRGSPAARNGAGASAVGVLVGAGSVVGASGVLVGAGSSEATVADVGPESPDNSTGADEQPARPTKQTSRTAKNRRAHECVMELFNTAEKYLTPTTPR